MRQLCSSLLPSQRWLHPAWRVCGILDRSHVLWGNAYNGFVLSCLILCISYLSGETWVWKKSYFKVWIKMVLDCNSLNPGSSLPFNPWPSVREKKVFKMWFSVRVAFMGRKVIQCFLANPASSSSPCLAFLGVILGKSQRARLCPRWGWSWHQHLVITAPQHLVLFQPALLRVWVQK